MYFNLRKGKTYKNKFHEKIRSLLITVLKNNKKKDSSSNKKGMPFQSLLPVGVNTMQKNKNFENNFRPKKSLQNINFAGFFYYLVTTEGFEPPTLRAEI